MIYVVQMGGEGGPVKIGISKNPSARLLDLSVGSPLPVVLLATMEGDRPEEAALHRRFMEYRLNGEWFQFCEDIRQWLQSLEQVPRSNLLKTRSLGSRRGWKTRKLMAISRGED